MAQQHPLGDTHYMTTPEQTRAEAIGRYVVARANYNIARMRADEAFRRYFAKREAGEKTSGAGWQRSENLANEALIVLYNAQSELYRHNIDPWDIDDRDGVERTPIGH